MWGAVFPAFIAGVAYVYDVSQPPSMYPKCCLTSHQNKYDWAGKLKGSSLQAGTPAVASTPATEE